MNVTPHVGLSIKFCKFIPYITLTALVVATVAAFSFVIS